MTLSDEDRTKLKQISQKVSKIACVPLMQVDAFGMGYYDWWNVYPDGRVEYDHKGLPSAYSRGCLFVWSDAELEYYRKWYDDAPNN